MIPPRDIVTASGQGGAALVPYEQGGLPPDAMAEAAGEPESEPADGPTAWRFWDRQIKAGLLHERRWRSEALACVRLYFGEDEDPGEGVAEGTDANRVSDRVALVHGTVDVLRPLVYSDTPQPLVRRRFRGDGRPDETAAMAAEAGQRLADYLIETSDFDRAMEVARDDWLIAGRGNVRVLYKARTTTVPGPAGVPVQVKTDERVVVRPVEWARGVLAPAASWEQLPWLAFEVPMTRGAIAERFGPEVAEKIAFTDAGLGDASRAPGDMERDRQGGFGVDAASGEVAASVFDTVPVWEVWDRTEGRVLWWTKAYTAGLLDQEDDTLLLEGFFPCPRLLVATTKGQALTPRPDIRYYERRAREVDDASAKVRSILDALSVSGLFPGNMVPEIKQLLDGKNRMIPIADWIGLIDKGGTQQIVQWLPIEPMVTAIQALLQMREAAKAAMFEASGVSDVMRAQGDPNETATAQQMKGRYAGLRLSERQRRMAIFCRDTIRLMLEVALEHFDTATIAEVCSLELPLTEAERQSAIQAQAMAQAAHAQAMQTYELMGQAVEAGLLAGPLPPPPEAPAEERIPGTSWELVHGRLRSDFARRITVAIETQSTVLADEQADKEARIEFLGAFATFVRELAPLAGSGQFDFKTVKELLLFGVRGFPKSRTLEGLIASLPDEPQGEPPEDTQVTVAKIKAEVDRTIKEMDLADHEAERQHEAKMKGVELMAEGAKAAAPQSRTPQQTPA